MSERKLAYLLKKFPRLSETFVLNEILAQERLGRPIQILSSVAIAAPLGLARRSVEAVAVSPLT